ncbi:hypothetical protein [Mesorhizobium sp. WSM2239]|uniref:Uncharacterized protein n=2 Tax=unclassified Mesorhizobium TaxID=325217 RepID=A0AAU8DHY4_9HYPH
MDVPLELTPGEEEALTRDRALTTDSKGRLTLVGLTVEESIWYVEHKRQWLAERIDDTLRRKSREGRKRYLELYERHEFARLQVIGAEHEVRTENPTKNFTGRPAGRARTQR